MRYGFIDFGMSRRFPVNSDVASRLVDVYSGRLHKAPELEAKNPYNPFPADVYQVGHMLLAWFYVRTCTIYP